MADDHIKRKILLLGDGAVGKTSLIRRFVVDKFSDDYITTIGTKVTKKDLRIEYPGKAVEFTLMIWDVLGQRGYKNIQASAFQGAKGAVLVSDLTRPETLASLREYWLPHLRKVVGSIPFVIVGNKSDIIHDRESAKENLDELAETFPVTCFLGSAKTGENVEASFLHLAKEMITTTGAPGGDEGPGLEDSEQGLIAVTDRIVMDFCDGMGGQEAAMPIVRQQLTRAGVDVKAPTVEGLRLAIEYLAETESAFRNADEVEASKLRRIGWIKELG